ncbi:hypothetical protein N7494_003115 [Penicillium frequentans]|uniref:non-specific serine/threonine protein kinase n=1 Tax=Penicillium frequentans TaxID=3151616 RepID=A0AAD6GII2_9EURO|nr:hypothetical protein N7494_003115 [Penicillium glabrum]
MSTSHQPALPISAHVPAANHAPSPAQKNARQYPDMLGNPPVPPPRTSSNRHSPNGSREKDSSRGKNRADRKENRDRDRDRNGKSRSRRDPTEPTRDSGRSRGATVAPPAELSMEEGSSLVKEPSTVINAVMVSDPVVDREREQVRQAGASPATPANTDLPIGHEGSEDGGRGPRSRHDYDNGNTIKRKETTFGSYILGQTLGEGEFGKVKLGWKRDGSIQVAIKLIRRDTLGTNPTRLPKIYREISILRDLAHPNIVRLHEMVETDRHIGIIMEYASGGELFDYILNHRYLKDNSARRLFAQLVSGVGYLHKKGIVHRDLKLENLLLDRNRNIIITDFGFANTFNPIDQLEEEIEYNLTNKEYVKRKRLDRLGPDGLRRGDLMQTSCGSPCYAAPELVVSDSLYTGRKVDVWSCGVILYAMLAGYLPFDDDPANPDGDNINLLYKYIVTTPLTFPEYVTPHARDLLRRILVPDPRKRADLFEVARHSWLSEYAHIVSHITSSTTNVADIANTTVPAESPNEPPPLARSASVREPPKTSQGNVPAVGGLNHHAGDVSQETPSDKSKTSRDAKRRTVQVEYVAPQSQTARGEYQPEASGSRSGGPAQSEAPAAENLAKPAPKPVGKPPINYDKPLPTHFPRSASDYPVATATHTTAPAPAPAPSSARPQTGGSMASFNTGRLPSRGQPVAPMVTATNTEGRLAQPKSRQFAFPQNPAQSSSTSIGRPSTQQLPSAFNPTPRQDPPAKGHKRSNTVSSIGERLFGRSASLMGGNRNSQTTASRTRPSKRYPPTSMKEAVPRDDSRVSMDSRCSMQNPHTRKASEAGEGRPRRFSLLPASFSFRTFSSARAQTPEDTSQSPYPVDPRSQQRPATGPLPNRPRATSYGTQEAMGMVSEGPSDEVHDESKSSEPEPLSYEAQIDQQFAELGNRFDQTQDSFGNVSSEHVYENPDEQYSGTNYTYGSSKPNYYDDYNSTYDSLPRQSMQAGRSGRGPGVLQKNNRKFADAYEYERDLSHHSGSSGAARKVMDFFRRRAKSRAGEGQ